MLEIVDCEQNSPEWVEARLGLPTASEFASIVADWEAANAELARWQRNRAIIAAVHDGRSRKEVAEELGLTASTISAIVKKGEPDEFSRPRAKLSATYLRKLAGERITGRPAVNVSTAATRRGHQMEPKARALYEFANGVAVERVGLIKNHGVGYSPDGLVGELGLLEIKSMEPHILIEHWEAGSVPPEHAAQIQGGMWVAEREWLDFCGYCPGMLPLDFRVARDDEFITQTLVPAIVAFRQELENLVARLSRGVKPPGELDEEKAG